MSKLVAEYLQHPLSASANIALLDDGSVGGVLGATLGSKLNIAGGKILQIVRATDSTSRSTTSTSFVDAGISVTITPQKNDSAIILVWVAEKLSGGQTNANVTQITDNSNNAISGAEQSFTGITASGSLLVVVTESLFAYSTPATTSATTYKGRFRSEAGASQVLRNNILTGQMYAIEVSA